MEDNPMFVMDLLASSSSSSSEEELPIAGVLSEVFEHHQKNELYAENIVPLYTDKQFIEHFKVPRLVLSNLADKFQQSAEKDTGFTRVSALKCLWVFCWYATHEAASFRDVADRFDLAISTLHNIIYNVTHFSSSLSAEIIRWPSDVEKEAIVAEFSEMGFPDVIGCIDGSHVRIDRPEHDPESYINRKKFYSIQAVCDRQRRFRDVFIGYPGSVHDARVFRNSPLYDTLAEKCGEKVILGDSAYPCLRNLLTPYKDNGNLTAAERNFNMKLSHCRILIEHSFGILKQRFRQLYHLKLRDISLICHFIRACCVLHNLCLDFEDNYIENDEEPNGDIPENMEENNMAGHAFRNYVAALLFNMDN